MIKNNVGDVVGDFKCITVNQNRSNAKYLDKVTSDVLSHWCNDAIHVLHNYDDGDYSHEESITENSYYHFKKYDQAPVRMRLLMEGIILDIPHSSLYIIKVDIDGIIDRFRKQVLDIDNNLN